MASCFKLFRIGAASHWVQELQVQELQVTQLTCMLCQGAPQIIVCMKGLCNIILSFIMSAKLEYQQHWRKCCSHKRKMLLFYPLFGTWPWYFYMWCNWLLGEKFKQFVYQLLFPFISFQALFFLTHDSAHCFLYIYECTTSSSFCWSQRMGLGLLWVGPRQHALRYVLLLWKCFVPWTFCHKITDNSIPGPAFLSISIVCNSKILPNIMRCITCSCLEFACCKIQKKYWKRNLYFKNKMFDVGVEPAPQLTPREFKRGLETPRALGDLGASCLSASADWPTLVNGCCVGQQWDQSPHHRYLLWPLLVQEKKRGL